jgi:hypothetical protein
VAGRRGRVTEERVKQIEATIADLEASGERWTNAKVYQRLGGSYSQLTAYLKTRRALHQAADVLKARRAEEAAVIAVAEPEEPEEFPAPEEGDAPARRLGTPPLILALLERDRVREREHGLGVEEQVLKVKRQRVEEAMRVEEYSVARLRSDALDLESRRRLRDLRQELEQVEAARRKVHQQRLEVHRQVLETAESFENLRGQAARWLRRLRESQRRSAAGSTAVARGDAREECEQATQQLARVVGQTEAEQLAGDPNVHPAWL